MSCPEILLVSGHKLKMQKILLFEQRGVNDVATLRAQAAKSLGGVSTGIGFIGSPTWALGGAAVLGLLESAMSKSAEKQALEMLKLADAKNQSVRERGCFIESGELSNAHIPHPQAWYAIRVTNTSMDLTDLSWGQRGNLLSKYRKSKSDILEEKGRKVLRVETEERYVHDGEEFVTLDTDVGVVAVRWSHVIAYFAPEPKEPQQIAHTAEQTIRYPECDLDPLADRSGPYEYKGYPYYSYPDGQVDCYTHRGWWRVDINDFRDYVEKATRDPR